MNTPTPRTDAAKQTVTILSSRCGLARKEYDGGEIEYVCVEDMAKLEQELNEARAELSRLKSPTPPNEPTEIMSTTYWRKEAWDAQSERDQLRKVVDELAGTIYVHSLRPQNALDKYNQLPHVLERKQND